MALERPKLVAGPPADAIDEMASRVLALANSWTKWDGSPLEHSGRPFTPHKAMRRVADHMLDHLAQLEAHLAGVPSLPDRWHASAMTTAADVSAFGAEDLDEARSRLQRLAALWRISLARVRDGDFDRVEGDAYTIREMASCCAASIEYADAVGDLDQRHQTAETAR